MPDKVYYRLPLLMLVWLLGSIVLVGSGIAFGVNLVSHIPVITSWIQLLTFTGVCILTGSNAAMVHIVLKSDRERKQNTQVAMSLLEMMHQTLEVITKAHGDITDQSGQMKRMSKELKDKTVSETADIVQKIVDPLPDMVAEKVVAATSEASDLRKSGELRVPHSEES